MAHEHILAKVDSLTAIPVAIEVLWEGDTNGWFVSLNAISSDLRTHPLGVISKGGDLRLFNGQVPPWPEAATAQQLGQEIASRFGAEFYFPSPNHPEESCPSWVDRHKGQPCRRCGILLLQDDSTPWRGYCYHCHLDVEREQREAKWTPEQRCGPRCDICGSPANKKLGSRPACEKCWTEYEVYACEKCSKTSLILKSTRHSSLCSRCELQRSIDSLTPAQRLTIRDAAARHRSSGISAAIDVLKCGLSDAQYVVQVLGRSDSDQNSN